MKTGSQYVLNGYQVGNQRPGGDDAVGNSTANKQLPRVAAMSQRSSAVPFRRGTMHARLWIIVLTSRTMQRAPAMELPPLCRTVPIKADAANDEANLVTRCIAFHSDWMDRTPDQLLEREAAARREIFPVAVVVVVHDDISLMRTTLEEVAVAVEHIVSNIIDARVDCYVCTDTQLS